MNNLYHVYRVLCPQRTLYYNRYPVAFSVSIDNIALDIQIRLCVSLVVTLSFFFFMWTDE